MMAQCIWSREGTCRAYIWRNGDHLPCNGHKTACFGKGELLVETEEFRIKRLSIREPSDAK